jgi:hypothetical protein
MSITKNAIKRVLRSKMGASAVDFSTYKSVSQESSALPKNLNSSNSLQVLNSISLVHNLRSIPNVPKNTNYLFFCVDV